MNCPSGDSRFASCATSTLRIIDANRNRAAEALRVVEEFFRFGLDDAELTRLCKQLRHELATLLSGIPEHLLCASRETATDVGTEVRVDDEYIRSTDREVACSSWKRLQQALRVLEEHMKVPAPETAALVEALRYRSYSLERCFQIAEHARTVLGDVRLYVLIDGCDDVDSMVRLAQSLIEAGVHALQLRDKSLTDRQLVDAARKLRRVTADRETLFVVNDRPDVAVLSGADAVHIGQEELTVKDARAIVGPEMLIGVSTHSLQQARQAVISGANYLGCGPTFPSTTKQFTTFAGLEFLTAVAGEIGLPAFAIGGIGPDNLSEVLATGVRRIAVGAAVTEAAQPEQAVRRLLEQLRTSPSRVSG
ncbi:MAG: thiamine phosphate synthase [Planctomycetaceae bacterium]|nr:thiamine phosphate synthase [Planctomycetaceae bacterium]